jgi:peptidoglycan-associated lipoprotein
MSKGLKWGLALVLVTAMAMTGCRTRRGGLTGGGIDDTFDPEGVGDMERLALGERFDDANRIRDVQFENVLFGYNSFQLAPGEMAKVRAVAEYMRDNPTTRLISEGHCDERGTREYNMSLGEYRALAVRAALVHMQIDPSRVQTRSYGEEQPVNPGHEESAWRENRRVEFALYR